MFKTLFAKIRGWMNRMGLIKGVKKLSDLKELPSSDEMYNQIEIWMALYRGYYEGWHKVKFHTINGERTRVMESLNMAKVASAEMASLVFNEKCEINISDKGLADNIEQVLKQNKFNKKFQDNLEYSFAHGGMAIKPYFNGEKIALSFVTADCFIPVSWHNDTITEAVFVSEYKRGDKKYTHLEWHLQSRHDEKGKGYTIVNELYESSNHEETGIKVPLSTLFDDLEEEVGIHPLEKPLFVYFKPNTSNNLDVKSPLGIAIYANALSTMKLIDTAFDSFHREFRLGKKRIIVPVSAIKAVPDENGVFQRYFDANDEVYQSMNIGDMDGDKIYDNSVELRIEEHIAAINALLNIFAMQTGFSSGAFTYDGQSMKTATEVISEQSKTFKTKQSHEVIIEAGLQELVDSIVAIAELYNVFPTPRDYEVSVSFDDSIAEDTGAEIDKQIKLVTNGLNSKKRAIMKILGVTEEEALGILKEVYEEERRMSLEFEEAQREFILFGERE